MPEELRQKIVGDFSLPLEFAVRFVNDPPLLKFFLQAVEFKPKNLKVWKIQFYFGTGNNQIKCGSSYWTGPHIQIVVETSLSTGRYLFQKITGPLD